MVYRYNQTSIYGITNPEPIIYGDGWIYGAIVPVQQVAVPKNVYVLHERDYNIISWENSGDTDMRAYVVYKSKTYGHSDEYIIAEISSKDKDGKTQTCYIDYLTDSELDTQYYYSVAAVDANGSPSFKSEWNADISKDVSYQQYAYLYTDGATQTYWNTLDLYKQLGNFDTDRNVVPFRDIGVDYIEKNGAVEEVRKNCNYLYATLLTLTDEQKSNFDRLEYKLFMDNTEIAYNKPNITSSIHIFKSDSQNLLNNLSINKDTFLNYFLSSNDYGEYSKIFTYISRIENPDNTLRILNIDRKVFFNKILEVNNNELPLTNSGDPNVVFIYNNGFWDLNIPANNNYISNINLKDYGISYSTYSVPVQDTTIEIHEYWTLDNETVYVNSIYDSINNTVELKDSSLQSYGITYNYNILNNSTEFTIEFARKAFIYFRVPYIYNSKILQTYITECGITGNITNRIINTIYIYSSII